MNPDTRLLESLARAGNEPAFRGYFVDAMADVHRKLLVAPDERTMQRLQGEGQFISKFLQLLDAAPKLLEQKR